MKVFLILALAWYAQDLAQILMTQTFLAPELFAVALLDRSTRSREPDSLFPWLFAALIGGLMTDLRWIGVPGLCAALYTVMVFAVRWFWYEIPSDGRKLLPYLIINACLCAIVTPVRLIFWDSSVTAGRLTAIAGAQWLLTGVVLIVTALTRQYTYDEECL